MIDTIKLTIPLLRPPVEATGFRQDIRYLNPHRFAQCYRYRNRMNYEPRVTYTQRPSQIGMAYELTVEVSLPKLVLGNNFLELNDDHFQEVVNALSDSLKKMGIFVSPEVISRAKVNTVHFSKNILK